MLYFFMCVVALVVVGLIWRRAKNGRQSRYDHYDPHNAHDNGSSTSPWLLPLIVADAASDFIPESDRANNHDVQSDSFGSVGGFSADSGSSGGDSGGGGGDGGGGD